MLARPRRFLVCILGASQRGLPFSVRTILALWTSLLTWLGNGAAAEAPVITQQPQKRIVVETSNHTFSVTASGTAPLSYQWRFNGSDLSSKTNASLALTNIQLSQAGGYQVVVTNTVGAVTSVVAMLTVRSTNDPVYPAPQGGWTYVYTGDSAATPADAALDGTWSHNNTSDSWDLSGRGAGVGLPGGISSANGVLTIEDAINSGAGSADNRRFYFTHNLAQEPSVTNANTLLDDGVTLTFRARLTPAAPTDPLTELTNAPSGLMNNGGGSGMVGIRQLGGSSLIISFGLNRDTEDSAPGSSFSFAQQGLHMNSLNGNTRSPSVDPNFGAVNLLPLDPTLFHEFWIHIQSNGSDPGTHRVSVYVDGAQTGAVFNVTAGTAAATNGVNYLGLGAGSTLQVGACDIDFLAYKPSVLKPSGFNDPVGIVTPPASQVVDEGLAAAFNVGVTGAPPYAFQWYQNGLSISGATNQLYVTPPVSPADHGAQFVVVVSNPFNMVTSSPPAVLSVDFNGPPVITAQPVNTSVTNGSSAQLHVTAAGNGTLTYQWRINGGNLPGATDAVLTLNNVSPANAGGYDVVVSSPFGSVTSLVATLTVRTQDFGDASDPAYPTLLANNGARHLISPGLHLGAGVDFELDGQPNASAAGDDAAGSDDEDGVRFPGPLLVGQLATVEVVASAGGLLNAWIDFNRNGSWAEAGEQIFTNRSLSAGTNMLSFPVASTTPVGATSARFRFSSGGGLSFAGPAADGEVEDYLVTLAPAANLAVGKVDTPDPVAVGSNLTYTIVVSNLGPSLASAVVLTDVLLPELSFTQATSSQGSCTQQSGTVTCSLGELAANATATVTIQVVANTAKVLTNLASVAAAEADVQLANNTGAAVTSILNPPQIITPPASRTVTNGVTVVLSVSAEGAAPLSYQWRLNSADLPGQTGATLTIANAQPSHNGTYTVRISNPVGTVESPPAVLTVLVPPSIVSSPSSRTNLAGSTASFTVVAGGTPPFAYQWFFNQSTALAGATNATLSLSPVQPANAGVYHAQVQNGAGLVLSAPATLTVVSVDFGDAPDPSYPTLLANNGARHRIVPGLRLGTTVDFDPDGQPSAGATGDDLAGADDEDGVTFTSSLLVGQLASLGVAASGAGLLNAWIDFGRDGGWGQPGDQIFTNQTLAAGANSLSIRVPLTASPGPTLARFRFSSAAGLGFVGEALDGEVEDYAVTIQPAVNLALSTLDLPAPVAVGSNLTYLLTVTNRGPSMATGVTLVDTLPAGVTFISATPSGCNNVNGVVTCSLGSVNAGAATAVALVVRPLSVGTLTNAASVTAAESELAPADNAALVATVVQAYPVITAQPQSLTVTNGDTVTFSVAATGTALQYQWRLNGAPLLGATNATLTINSAQGADAGNYTVLVSNGVGIALSATATLIVRVRPTILVQPQSLTATNGLSVSLSVTGVGSEPLRYQWSFNGAALPNATNATLLFGSVQTANAGGYRVSLSNAFGFVLSDLATLTVLVPPQITQHPQSRTNAGGTTATFAVAATGSAPLSYQWQFNLDTILSGETNSSLVLTNVQPDHAGSYRVRVSNAAGVADSSPATLTVAAVDFGDAPQPSYPTTLANNGARHSLVAGMRLGARADFENDGQPTATALGDDNAAADDEDGVLFSGQLPLGQTLALPVVASTNGFLNAWVDYNRNGSWGDLGEQVFVAEVLMSGTNFVPLTVPANAPTGSTFARFRFSSVPGLSFSGPAMDGEVEDYQVSVIRAIDLALTMQVSAEPVLLGANFSYTLNVTNRGAIVSTNVQLVDELPAEVRFVSATTSQGGCSHSNGVVRCTLNNLAGGAQANVTITVNAAVPGTVTNAATVTASEIDFNPSDNVARVFSSLLLISPPMANSAPITILDFASAAPYPSTILVAGLTTTVHKVSVTLSNLTHTFPEDIDMLLVGPRGQAVVLMSDAGAGHSINNVSLTFDDAAPLSLPGATEIFSDGYRPTDFGPTSADTFAAPAPAGPYATVLSAFAGTDPNGPWSLYVVDDSEQDNGFIASGWRLALTTVNPFADLAMGLSAIPESQTVGGPVTYTVQITNRGPLTATGVVLTDPLPTGAVFGSASASQGSCTNDGGIIRCALGSLANSAQASVTIVLNPTQAGRLTNSASVTARQVDSTPANSQASVVTTVRNIADLTLVQGVDQAVVPLEQPLTYTLRVTNQGPHAATAVRVTDSLPGSVSLMSAVASQGSCGPQAGLVVCDLGPLTVGAQATVTVVVMPHELGLITNLAVVSSEELDVAPANNSAAVASRVVFVSAPFANSAMLTIPETGPANPYPSTLVVSGLTAAVHKVTVTLSNLSHPAPDDLDILLVGPEGQAAVLMSDAGGVVPLNGVTLTFDDEAAALPDETAIGSGAFRPGDFAPTGEGFPQPAPTGPHAASLAAFRGADPNGLWSLYVLDDQAPQSGLLALGWSLKFTVIDPIADLAVAQSANLEIGVVGSDLTYSIAVTNRGPGWATEAALVDTLPAGVNFVSALTTQGSCTPAGGSVNCSLGSLPSGGGALITLVVVPTAAGRITNTASVSGRELDVKTANNLSVFSLAIEAPPAIVVPPQNQAVGAGLPASFSVIATGSEPLRFQWERDGLTIAGATASTLVLPAVSAADTGAYRVSVSNRVGRVLSESALLRVFIRPTLSDIPDQITLEDTPTAAIAFTVQDDQTPAGSLTLSASSDNSALVPNGGVTFGGSGGDRNLVIRPGTNQTGSALITVTVTDGDGVSSSDGFMLTVQPVNDPPELSVTLDHAIDEDTNTGPIPVTVTDPETPAAELVFTAISSNPDLVPDANMVLGGISSGRSLTITPRAEQAGSTLITLSVADGQGLTTTNSFVLTVRPVNDPPTLAPIGSLTIPEDSGPQTVAFSGIGSGATNEIQGFIVTAVSSLPGIIPDPTVEYTSPQATGLLRFAPVPNRNGVVTLTVTVNDGGATNNLTSQPFTVTISPDPDAPALSPIADQIIQEDATLGPIPFLVADDETPAASLIFAVDSSNPALVAGTNFVLGGSGTNRTLTVTPKPNQSGRATITLSATDDDNNTATVQFQLLVLPGNDPPTVRPLTDQVINEDGATAALPFFILDDSPLENLQVSAKSSRPALVRDSDILLGGSGTNRTVVVRPVTNQFGSCLITLTVSDGAASTNVSFILTVNPVNDPPVISDVPNQVMNEDAPLAVPFVVSDAEADATLLTIISVSSSNPALIPASGLAFSGSGRDRRILVTPAANQSGTVTLGFTISDGTNNTSESFVATVLPVNDPPTLGIIVDRTVPEDSGPQVVTLTGIGTGAANEAQTLTVTAVSSDPTLLPNPTISYTSPASTGTLTFTPVAQRSGAAIVTVMVDDGEPQSKASRSFIVTVTPFADPPILSDITNQTTAEDTPLAIPFTVSDVDSGVFGLTLSATSTNTALVANTNLLFGGSGTNRTLLVVPTTNQFGVTLINLTVGDGLTSASDSFLLTVTAVNDPPTLVAPSSFSIRTGLNDQTFTVTGISSGAPNETQPLSLAAVSSDPGIVVVETVSYSSPNPSGTIRLDYANGPVGTSTVSVTVNDGQPTSNLSTQRFTVSLFLSANTAPTISAIPNQTTSEDTATGQIAFTINDTGTPANLLTVAGSSSNTNLVPNSNILLGGAGNSRNVTLVPASNQVGSASITLTVTDTNFGLVSTNFLLTVNPVNDPPSISDVPDQNIAEDMALGPIDFLVGDLETAAAKLTMTFFSSNPALVPSANILLGGSGTNRSVFLRPATNQTGSSTITLTVSDGLTTRSDTFVLAVTSINDPPSLTDIPNQFTSEDTPSPTVNFTVADAETPAGSLALSATSSNPAVLPAGNVVFGGSDGIRTVTMRPATNASGSSLVTVTLSDGQGGFASDSFSLTVNPINDVPTLGALTNLMVHGDAVTRTVALTGIGSGAELENQTLAISAVSSNPGVVPHPMVTYVSPNATGTLTLLGLPGTNGSATIMVTVNDGQLQNNLVTRTFTVAVNGLPTISELADRAVNQDTSAGPIPFAIRDAETAAANLNLSAISSNTNLVPNANVILGGSGTNRNVTIQPAPMRSGLTLITLTVSDANGGSSSESFSLTVINTTNDPPTLDPIGDLTINENAGLRSVLLTGISPGPLEEHQPLTITARSSHPAIIPHPTVNYPGADVATLTFASSLNATGVVTLTVTVDDGQPFNHEVSRHFNVTLFPADDLPVIIAQPQDRTVALGGQTSFSVGATSLQFLSYQWRFNTVNLSGRTNAILVLSDLQASAAGDYSVVVSNADGSVTSQAARLRLLPAPTILAIQRTGQTARIFFTSEAGLQYTVEFKTGLGDQVWTALPPVTGTGTVMMVEDVTVAGATRLYRVHVE